LLTTWSKEIWQQTLRGFRWREPGNQEAALSERNTHLEVGVGPGRRRILIALSWGILAAVVKPVAFWPQGFDSSTLIKMHERAPEFPNPIA